MVDGGPNSIDEAIDRMVEAANNGEAISIGLVGSIVELWERCVVRNIKVDLEATKQASTTPTKAVISPLAGRTTRVQP